MFWHKLYWPKYVCVLHRFCLAYFWLDRQLCLCSNLATVCARQRICVANYVEWWSTNMTYRPCRETHIWHIFLLTIGAVLSKTTKTVFMSVYDLGLSTLHFTNRKPMLRYIGHVSRKPFDNIESSLMTGLVGEYRRRGRSRIRWFGNISSRVSRHGGSVLKSSESLWASRLSYDDWQLSVCIVDIVLECFDENERLRAHAVKTCKRIMPSKYPSHSSYYPHMPIGMAGIYRLLFFCFFVCRILVTDISGVGWHREMKFCRMLDLGVHQAFSPFGEIWPRG